jgi:hypothetical protein
MLMRLMLLMLIMLLLMWMKHYGDMAHLQHAGMCRRREGPWRRPCTHTTPRLAAACTGSAASSRGPPRGRSAKQSGGHVMQQRVCKCNHSFYQYLYTTMHSPLLSVSSFCSSPPFIPPPVVQPLFIPPLFVAPTTSPHLCIYPFPTSLSATCLFSITSRPVPP